MKNFSIFKQILISNLLVLLLVIIIITMLTIPKQKEEFTNELTNHAIILLNTLDKALADELYFMDIDYLSDNLQSLAMNNNSLTFCRIYDSEGHIIADSFNLDITFSLEKDPFAVSVLSESSYLIRWEKDQLLVGKKIVIENQVLGLLVIGLSTQSHKKVLASMTKQIFLTSIIAIIAGTILSLVISRKITRPIKLMAKKTIDISNGNFKNPILITQKNELGQLADAFNKMMRELSANIKRLKTSENRFSNAVRGTNDGIWDWDIKNNRAYFSQRWKNMLGYDEKELKNDMETWFGLIHKSDLTKVKKALDKHLSGKTPCFICEYRILCKNNEYLWVLTRGIVTKDRNNANKRIAGSQTDITETKNYQKELEKSLKEKEILLKEIHHRVKNNLAIIQSLIGFDARKLKTNKELYEIMQKLQNRIQSIALIHQLLYQTKDVSHIKADKYLKQIIINLNQTINSRNSDITISLESISKPLNIDILKTLGLIINELITNSVKYAFPDKKGSINIYLNENKLNYNFEVKDDGIGFPENFDIQKIKSGLFLVSVLSQGFHGSLEIKNQKGACVSIAFPKKIKNHTKKDLKFIEI